MEDSRERAVEAFWILNDFVGDLIGATRAFEYFDTPKFEAGATDQVLRIYNKMADSYLFVTLAKWIEFYDRYHVLISSDARSICEQLRNELDKRGGAGIPKQGRWPHLEQEARSSPVAGRD